MGRVGEALRSARMAKQIPLQRVERDTKIRLAHLEALEAGEYRKLPAPVYARAYLRTYATYLGLDPAPLVAAFNEECDVADPKGVQSEARVRGGGPVISAGPIIALSVVVLALALGYYFYQQYGQFVGSLPFGQGLTFNPVATATPQPTQVVVSRPTSTPKPSPTATATPIPSVTVAVKIMERCWFQVAVDGTPVYTGTLEAGETRSWTGKSKVAMRAGNPNGVEVSVDGKPWQRLAPYGGPPANYEWTPSQH